MGSGASRSLLFLRVHTRIKHQEVGDKRGERVTLYLPQETYTCNYRNSDLQKVREAGWRLERGGG